MKCSQAPQVLVREGTAAAAKIDGRTVEIQRLIGRSLRSVIDMEKLGERTIWIDCDVIQADGGTRTASITGAFVALYDAVTWLMEEEVIDEWPINGYVAATVSVSTRTSPLWISAMRRILLQRSI